MSAVTNLKGSNLQAINVPVGTDQQRGITANLLAGLEPFLQGSIGHLGQMATGGTPEMWQQLEAPAMRQFGQLQGSLASRFSGMGGSGARRSSGFQNTMGAASSELAQDLQSQRLGYQNQAIQQLLSMGQNLLTTPMQQTYLQQKPKSAIQELLMSLAPGLAQGATGFGSSALLLKLFPKLMGFG